MANSKILVNQWRNEPSSRDQLGHQLAFTKSAQEPDCGPARMFYCEPAAQLVRAATATRYFISSLRQDAREILRAVRARWAVENTLHWSLNIAFREDESRIHVGHAQQHLALVRKLALNLLRNEKNRQRQYQDKTSPGRVVG